MSPWDFGFDWRLFAIPFEDERFGAVEFLSIRATSASVERLFSVAAAIIHARCNRLSASTVKSMLLCIQVTE